MLLKFFLNGNTESYLRGLEQEFDVSTNVIRVELNKFEKAGLLQSKFKGNKKLFKANTSHPLFKDIHNIILKHVGIDKVIDEVALKLGSLDCVYLTGKMAEGIDSGIIDVIFVGEKIDVGYLLNLIEKAEKMIDRKIRYLLFDKVGFDEHLTKGVLEAEPLLLWKAK